MPFNLTNTPPSFQAYAHECFYNFLDLFCIVFFDDIFVFSETLEKHVAYVKQVLSRLRDYGLTCNLKKCEFHVSFLSFFGFIISSEGVSIDSDHIFAITEWPVLQNVHKV